MYKFTERANIIAVPPAVMDPAVTSAWIPMEDWREITAVVSSEAQPAGATQTAQLLQATDQNGTGAKALTDVNNVVVDDSVSTVPAGSPAPLTATLAAFNTSLDTANGFRYVALVVATSTAVRSSATIIQTEGRFK